VAEENAGILVRTDDDGPLGGFLLLEASWSKIWKKCAAINIKVPFSVTNPLCLSLKESL
jgi:hypothetical protein